VLIFIIWFAWAVYRESGRKERELSRQGFHIEWISAGVLRGEPDDTAFVYHEPIGAIWFVGKSVGRDSIVTIPDGHAWEQKVPDWAKGKRQVIVRRIRDAYPRTIIQ
jgi:hypothetical protein